MQQHGMVNKNYDIEEDSNFDINFLKDIISSLKKISVINFLVKHQMSPVATYSYRNCDNKILIMSQQKQSKTRNAMRCNNRDDLLHLSFTLKISIFSIFSEVEDL